MTNPVADLFGQTETKATLQQYGMQPVGLSFSNTIDEIFERVGTNGCPNPATDPYGCLKYINNIRKVIQGAANQKPLIRLADRNLNILCALTGEISCTAEELMADAGQCKIVILLDNWLENYMINETTVNQDLHILIDPIPTYPVVGGVTLDWQIRWGGKVHELSVVQNEDGISTIEILAISHRAHTKHLLYGATPWFPPEVQPLKMWVLPGPLRSILFASGVINLARLFVPGLSAITNAFNPASWLNPLNPDALLNINPLSWPIQCAFVNPVLDTSDWSVLAATWTDWHSTMADLLSNAGCICRAYTWLTTDATSPHTELADLLTGQHTDNPVDLVKILGVASQSELTTVLEAVEGDIARLARPTRNCFRGTERFLTSSGTKTFAETVGTEQKVLGYRGEWTPARIESFGKQELYRVAVSRHGVEKEIFTTAEHRWFRAGRRRMKDGSWSTETTTRGLHPGDQLASKFKTSHLQRSHPSRDARGHGDFADWTVVSVEPTGIVEDVYCAVVPDGQAFTLDGNILTGNCVVLAFEDKSGVNGPTGTALDGLLSTIGVTLDDLITSVIFDQQSETFVAGEEVIDTNAVTPFFQSLLGVKLELPKVVWREGQFTGMVHREVNLHKASPLTMMVGGRSPTIVNELQTFGIRYGLAELSYVPTLWAGASSPIGAGGPNNLSPEVPLTPGLDNIYQGQLDNILFAWERYTDPLRALWTGEAAYQEYIERGTTSAYTVAGWLSLAEAHWKTRAFYGFISKAMNGFPWVYGVDYQLGDRIGFEMDGIIYVDQLAAIKWDYNRNAPIFMYVSVGDDRDKHDPIAAGMRTLQGVYTLVGAFLGEGTLFG